MSGDLPDRWPSGAGEMAARIRAFDWSTTPLGLMAEWPQSLKTTVDNMLGSGHAMMLAWGPERTILYNDAYVSMLGDWHPDGLGLPLRDAWPDIWDEISPLVDRAFAGETVRFDDMALTTTRHGHSEPSWWTCSYSPVRNEAGETVGLLNVTVDATAQVRAKSALREIEARHRLLIESWAQAVWETAPDGVVVADSLTWRAYTGQRLEEWLGDGWLDAIHPDDRAYAERQWREAIIARGPVDAEFRLRAPAGGWRWTNVRAAPVLDEAGQIERWAGINIDIDARKRAEAALRESEERYRALFAASPAPFLILRPDSPHFTITEVNQAYLAVTMRTREEVIGRGVFEAFPDNPANAGDASVSTLRASLEKVLATKRPDILPGLKYDIARPDATFEQRWWSPVNSPLLDEHGEVAAIIHNAHDVTEERRAEAALSESEAQYRVLFDSIDDGFSVIEVLFDDDDRPFDYRFLKVNPAFERQTGLRDPIGRTILSMAPEHEPFWFETYGRIVRTGRSEQFDHRADALGRWHEVDATPIGASGENQVAVVFRDVLHRRKAEEALRGSEERFRALVTAGGNSIYRMSPDWRLMYQLDSDTLADTSEPIEDWVEKYILPEDLPAVQAAIGAAIRSKSLFELEHRVWAADGGVAWVISRAVPLLGPDGEIVEWFGAGTVVTLRKQAEAALRDSEERYRALFESMDEAYAVVEVLRDDAGGWADFRFIEVNPAFIVHTNMPYPVGKTATELLGTPNPRWTELYGQALDTGETLRVEESEATLGITFDLNIFALDRVRNRVAVLFTNITDRKQAEAALRESEERFRQFSEASSDALWIVDAATGRLEYLSPAFDRMWGVPRETMMADLSRWADMVHPDDREQALTALPRALAGEPVIQDYRIVRGDGVIRYITDVGFPIFGDNGRVVRVGGIAQDLTERREAEAAVRASERFSRALVEGVPQLVWRAVDDGHWTWASPQWTTFTGKAERDSHGRGWLEPVHPDDREGVLAIWGGAIERGEFHADYRLRDMTEDRYRWFQSRATPVRDDDGAIVEWLGTSTDVDDIRAMQERQGVLVAELQHRTRNLMGVVRSMADRTGEASGDLEDFRTRFRDRLEALARVQGLLSRLGDTDRIAFDELIGTEIRAMDGAAERVTLDGPAGIRLRSSMVQTLAMALHELATNAMKYGALGQPQAELAIRWRMTPPDKRGRPWLQIDWRESGVRMPPVGAGPEGTGQGRELIEEALPYQLSAETSFELGPDGVHCTISIPVSASNVEQEGTHA